ncbi:hypothetical protein R1flu_016489 [Riccia fluitans]|uniref:Uncharacterized protein n=1 Tax=Riccia fluitans TaxID=41844 RepID=A0ABD1YM02_9MARC
MFNQNSLSNVDSAPGQSGPAGCLSKCNMKYQAGWLVDSDVPLENRKWKTMWTNSWMQRRDRYEFNSGADYRRGSSSMAAIVPIPELFHPPGDPDTTMLDPLVTLLVIWRIVLHAASIHPVACHTGRSSRLAFGAPDTCRSNPVPLSFLPYVASVVVSVVSAMGDGAVMALI